VNKSGAVQYFELSADPNLAETQLNYGFMFGQGEGILINQSLTVYEPIFPSPRFLSILSVLCKHRDLFSKSRFWKLRHAQASDARTWQTHYGHLTTIGLHTT
jgi:TPR repeat protein